MIELRHLRKEFEDVTPLEDVNVTIHSGDVISVILCTQGCMLKHSLGAFSSGKMTLGPNERDTSSITYCGRSLANSAPFRDGVVDLTFLLWVY